MATKVTKRAKSKPAMKPRPKSTLPPAPASEVTSPEVARVAARALRVPDTITDDEVRIIAASALTQAIDVSEPGPDPVPETAEPEPVAPPQLADEVDEAARISGRLLVDLSHATTRIGALESSLDASARKVAELQAKVAELEGQVQWYKSGAGH